MNIFRLQLRFLIPLVITLLTAAALAFHAFDVLTEKWFIKDTHMRSQIIATALSDSISKALNRNAPESLNKLFSRTVKDDRLDSIGLCDPQDKLLLKTATFPEALSCTRARQLAKHTSFYRPGDSTTLNVSAEGIILKSGLTANLILLHDIDFIEHRQSVTARYVFTLLIALGIAIMAITMITAQLGAQTLLKGLRNILSGNEFALDPPFGTPSRDLPKELALDVRTRLRDMEDEFRRQRHAGEAWTADHLRSLLRIQLRGEQVIVLSNREPWIHDRENGKITVHQPASGLVTAIEPIVAACNGTWIAHGSGSADRDVTDTQDTIALPPDQPAYRLRRIWLSEEEVSAYYDNMSNRGLWPMSHLAHVQPEFDEESWACYVSINQRFADAAIAESKIPDPVVLVQDYHLALAPRMIREKLPAATIISFWHIPWPNPESFMICPWKEEILRGLLGSTILGFHTNHYRNNFIDTVDRLLEARVEHEHSKILFNGHETLIESYPASIIWQQSEAPCDTQDAHRRICATLGLPGHVKIIVGVDRFDYTKGIPERFAAYERFLESTPKWLGQVVFIQIAAPSREHIDDYQTLHNQTTQQVEDINRRFGTPEVPAIILRDHFHNHEQINALFRAADVCIVSSLHDGMNLVCKEFIAARDDELGVLLLSQFTGASRELPEALSINPYHREGMAVAIRQALEMPPSEQRERMANMRATVCDANVFRWAGRMLSDASRQRLQQRIEHRVQAYHSQI